MGSHCLIITANIFSTIMVVFTIVAFATDHWVETDVDRSRLSAIELQLSDTNGEMGRVFHSRHRGIMRECYPDSDAEQFLTIAEKTTDGNCFFIDFDEKSGSSSDYDTRIHLLRSVLGTFVVGMVMVIITVFLGIIICIFRNVYIASAAAICSLVAGILMLLSIVLFHITEYIESNEEGQPGELVFENTWSTTLLRATDSEFGYSYALAWVSIILAGFVGLLYLLVARALRREILEDDGTESVVSERKAVIRRTKSSRSKTASHVEYDNGYAEMPMPYYNPGFVTVAPEVADMQVQPAVQYPNAVYALPPTAAYVSRAPSTK